MTCFRFPGGKARKSVKEKIFARFPAIYDTYVELFLGGGSVFLDVSTDKTRIVNDINAGLISVYLALRDNPDEFIAACRNIAKHLPEESLPPPAYNKRLKDVFNQLVKSRDTTPALSYFFINRTVFAGRVNYAIPSRLYFSNPTGWNIVFTDALEKVAEKLKNTIICCGDYKYVNYPAKNLPLNKGEETFIYADPPYYCQTFTTPSSQLYEHCFSEQDHRDLMYFAANCNAKILISYDDCPEIRSLYKRFNIYEENWTYCGTSSAAGQPSKKKIGKELLITNY